MADRFIVKDGKKIDLDLVDCESVFNNVSDIKYCEFKKERYLMATEEVEKYF